MNYFHQCQQCGAISPEHSTFRLYGYHFCSEAHMREYANQKSKPKEEKPQSTYIMVAVVVCVAIAVAGIEHFKIVPQPPAISTKEQ